MTIQGVLYIIVMVLSLVLIVSLTCTITMVRHVIRERKNAKINKDYYEFISKYGNNPIIE